jgi:hypothetical protein
MKVCDDCKYYKEIEGIKGICTKYGEITYCNESACEGFEPKAVKNE